MRLPWLLSCLAASCGATVAPLVTLLPPPGSSSSCSSTSCQAQVDTQLFLSKASITLPCTSATFHYKKTLHRNVHVYTTDENGEAVITLNTSSTMFGNIRIGDRFYSLDYASSGHQWQEEGEDEYVPDPADAETPAPSESTDNTTMVEYTSMVYFTPTFESETDDIGEFLEDLVTITNEGYKNSEVRLKMKVHCVEKAEIDDIRDKQIMLEKFKRMKGDTRSLLNSADVAVLLVGSSKLAVCGRAVVNGIATNETIAVVRRDCANRHYTFGHEIAHTIGTAHDHGGSTWPFGRARLWRGGKTILGTGYGRQRINYYSNPAVTRAGEPTGEEERNNAAVIQRNREALAAIGDESSVCKPGEIIYRKP